MKIGRLLWIWCLMCMNFIRDPPIWVLLFFSFHQQFQPMMPKSGYFKLLSYWNLEVISNIISILTQRYCRFQRPPGPIPSSMLGLEALTGSLDDFGFEDYLNGKMGIYEVAYITHLILLFSIFFCVISESSQLPWLFLFLNKFFYYSYKTRITPIPWIFRVEIWRTRTRGIKDLEFLSFKHPSRTSDMNYINGLLVEARKTFCCFW